MPRIPGHHFMNVKYLKHRISDLEEAKRKVEEEILNLIDKEARKKKIDRLEFLVYKNLYWRGGKLVKNKEIDLLLELYDINIHSSGFNGIWNAEDGWL